MSSNQADLHGKYGIDEHRHRFAVWAAARAAQRGFTKVDSLRKALESCGVREFLASRDVESIDEHGFNDLHGSWCSKIMEYLIHQGISNVTFGRAAKLLAIYLKSVVVLGPAHGSRLSNIAHPPIDGILLSNLSRSKDLVSPHKVDWATIRWTKLGKEDYYKLIAELRAVLPGQLPFWRLEEYWTVTEEQVLR
jgi:hypothetical protein